MERRFERKKYTTRYYGIKVVSVSYSIMNGIVLSLEGFNYTMYAKPEEVHFGGKNGEIGVLTAGGYIDFDFGGSDAVREIKNVVLRGDGRCEVDENGNLVKW